MPCPGISFDSASKNLSGTVTQNGVDGVVGPKTLTQLRRVWKHYARAFSAFQGAPEIRNDTVSSHWWAQLADLVSEGGKVPYQQAHNDYNLEATYTSGEAATPGESSIHSAIVQQFPEQAQGIGAEGLFQAWSRQESGNHYWGDTGSPETPFRIHEGAGDEEGIFGFDHIVWKRKYGDETDCDALRGYKINEDGSDNDEDDAENSEDGTEDNVSLYHPRNSVLAVGVAASPSSVLSLPATAWPMARYANSRTRPMRGMNYWPRRS